MFWAMFWARVSPIITLFGGACVVALLVYVVIGTIQNIRFIAQCERSLRANANQGPKPASTPPQERRCEHSDGPQKPMERTS